MDWEKSEKISINSVTDSKNPEDPLGTENIVAKQGSLGLFFIFGQYIAVTAYAPHLF